MRERAPLFIIDIVTTPFLSAVFKVILRATPCQMTRQNTLLLSGRGASAADCNLGRHGLDNWRQWRCQRLRSGPTLRATRITANDSDSRYSPVTLALQVLFLLHLADKILSRVHVFCDYIIIEGNQHACLAAYVPCNKNTVISSVNATARPRPWQCQCQCQCHNDPGPGLARLPRLELCFVICSTVW